MRTAKKFLRKRPELIRCLEEVIDDLKDDPLQSHLELHALRGKLDGVFAVSITYSQRLTLTIKITKKGLINLDIGSHDEIYRKSK